MKRIFLPVAMIAGIFLALSCGNNNDKKNSTTDSSRTTTVPGTDTTKTDTAHKHDPLESIHRAGIVLYSIETPPRWTKMDTIDKNNNRFVRLTAPLDGGDDKFNDNINIITDKLLKPEGGVEEYYKNAKQDFRDKVPTFNLLSEGNATVGGQPAKWFRYTLVGNKIPYQFLEYLVAKGDVGNVITCISDQKYYKSYEKTFKDAVASFKFTE